MATQLKFELDLFEKNGLESVREEWAYRNLKTKKWIEVEPGTSEYKTNLIWGPSDWSKEDLQGLTVLLLKSAMVAKKKSEQKRIFALAKSYVFGTRPYGEFFRGIEDPENFYPEEVWSYVKKLDKEAEFFILTGECDFAPGNFKFEKTTA